MFETSTTENRYVEYGDEVTNGNINQIVQSPYSAIKQHRRQHSVQEYIDTLFNRYARLLVIRVDFHYRTDIPVTKTIDDVVGDFVSYRNNERWNAEVCKGKVGYIRIVEYGQSKGFHIHYMAFYDGSKRKGDEWLADKIGELWNRTVQGLGYHFNCNTEDYAFKAIGMIHRNEVHVINHMKQVVANYLTKLSQQPVFLQGRRLFQTGRLNRV